MLMLSDPVSFRKAVAGASLVGFPLAGLVSAILDADVGTGMEPSSLYAVLVGHERAIMVAALLFIVSAVLTVPALGGILHLLRARGAALGHIGAALVLIGAMGHMGYATWQMMLSYVPREADRAAMVAYLDRSSSVSNVLLLPMLIAVSLGLILVAVGLRRARVVPMWVPILALSTVAAETVIDAFVAEPGKWPAVIIWSLALAAFGYVGFLVLRMTGEEWVAFASRPSRAIASTNS